MMYIKTKQEILKDVFAFPFLFCFRQQKVNFLIFQKIDNT